MMSLTSAADTKRSLSRVLVVEDDMVLALAIEDALIAVGAVQVVICPSIALAMHALEEAEPDCLVLDVHLADRNDGWALAELVDQLGPRRPTIAFSTGSPESIPRVIAEMGLVFEKPYDPAELAQALASGPPRGFFARLRDAIG